MPDIEKPKRKTHTSTAVKNRYKYKMYTRIPYEAPKELAARFKAKAKAKGVTMSSIFRKAIEDFLDETDVAENYNAET